MNNPGQILRYRKKKNPSLLSLLHHKSYTQEFVHEPHKHTHTVGHKLVSQFTEIHQHFVFNFKNNDM